MRQRINFSTDECNVCIRIRFVYTFLFAANGALCDCAVNAVDIYLKIESIPQRPKKWLDDFDDQVIESAHYKYYLVN